MLKKIQNYIFITTCLLSLFEIVILILNLFDIVNCYLLDNINLWTFPIMFILVIIYIFMETIIYKKSI